MHKSDDLVCFSATLSLSCLCSYECVFYVPLAPATRHTQKKTTQRTEIRHNKPREKQACGCCTRHTEHTHHKQQQKVTNDNKVQTEQKLENIA